MRVRTQCRGGWRRRGNGRGREAPHRAGAWLVRAATAASAARTSAAALHQRRGPAVKGWLIRAGGDGRRRAPAAVENFLGGVHQRVPRHDEDAVYRGSSERRRERPVVQRIGVE